MLIGSASTARADETGPAYPFCATDLTSLGSFVAAGTVTFDTSALTFAGVPGGVDVGGIAVFVFDSISVPSGTTIVGVGSRPLALVSKSTIQVDGVIHLSGRSAGDSVGGPTAGGAGGGGGAAPGTTIGVGPGAGQPGVAPAGSGGGGFGGRGGEGGGTGSGAGGLAYGNLGIALAGGSGGASGTGVSGTGGGGGGGALLLSALEDITIGSTGAILANGGNGAASSQGASAGGSGGAIVLFAPDVVNSGVVRANGGHGGAGECCGAGGGGGGGGGRIAVAGASSGSGVYSVNGGFGGAAAGGGGANGSSGVITFNPILFASCSTPDATPPVVTVPADITIEATGPSGAAPTFTATATDDVDGPVGVTCTPPSGSTFALGATTVNCVATDAAGNGAATSFTVTVVDTTAPSIVTVTPSQSVLRPPNHRMVPITVAVQSTDVVSTPACQISSVTSNEPDNGTGDGDTPNDVQSITGLSVALRAERVGGGAGRVYTIRVSCVDAAGNTAQSLTTVTVPVTQ